MIYHYTPATGHGRWSPRSEVTAETMVHLKDRIRDQLVASSTDSDENVPMDLGDGWAIGYMLCLDSGAWMWTLGRHNVRLVSCWLLATPEQAEAEWADVRREAERYDNLAVARCPETPCLAAVLVTDVPADRETWEAVADLERCVAWLLMDMK